MSAKARTYIIAVVVLIVAGTFLGFTKPGHKLLYQIGFTSACDGACN